MSDIKMGDKLYVIVRGDISPGYQIAQACHGLREFSSEHPEIDGAWFKQSNYIAVLAARCESHIIDLATEASALGIRFSLFREPDISNQATSIVLEPSKAAARLCRKLPLALSAV